MKKIISVLLAAVMMITAVSCGNEQLNAETAEAITAMAKHDDIESEIRLWANSGSDKVLVYEDLFTVDLMEISDMLSKYSLDMLVNFSYDEKENVNLAISIPTTESERYKKIFDVMFVENKIYLGTDIIKTLVDTVLSDYELAEFVDLLFKDYEYIVIDEGVSELLGLDINNGMIDEIKEKSKYGTETFINALKYIFPKIITDDLNLLSKEDGYYILTMNEKDIQAVLKTLIIVLEENMSSIIDTVIVVIPDVVLTEDDVSVLLEMLEEISESDVWESVFANVEFRVKSDDKTQNIVLDVEILHNEFEQVINFGFEITSKVMSDFITAPANKIVTMYDILNQFGY